MGEVLAGEGHVLTDQRLAKVPFAPRRTGEVHIEESLALVIGDRAIALDNFGKAQGDAVPDHARKTEIHPLPHAIAAERQGEQ